MSEAIVRYEPRRDRCKRRRTDNGSATKFPSGSGVMNLPKLLP
jgi:hypothetical protein